MPGSYPALHRTMTPEERMEFRRKKRRDFLETKALTDSLTVTLDDIKYALVQAKGSLAKAAESLGTTRAVLKRKVRMSPVLEALMAEIREEKLDLAEYKLTEQVEKGYFPAIAFMLRTLGKDRGYSERNTMEHQLSGKGAADAASLIEAMKHSFSLEELKTIEVKDYEWESESDSPKLLPTS